MALESISKSTAPIRKLYWPSPELLPSSVLESKPKEMPMVAPRLHIPRFNPILSKVSKRVANISPFENKYESDCKSLHTTRLDARFHPPRTRERPWLKPSWWVDQYSRWRRCFHGSVPCQKRRHTHWNIGRRYHVGGSRNCQACSRGFGFGGHVTWYWRTILEHSALCEHLCGNEWGGACNCSLYSQLDSWTMNNIYGALNLVSSE